MSDVRTTPGSRISNGHDAYLAAVALRQPADALGPRAQRTIARIIDATRDVFLRRGYSGTTIDEVTRIARVSRASFYTYFASKREVLLAVGAHTASESVSLIDRLPELGTTRLGLRRWVSDYFDLLDVHGSFALAWTQAAREDEEIRTAGMKRHLRICRQIGESLAATAGKTVDQPALLGLVATSVLERSWNYAQLYADAIDRTGVIEQVAHTLWGMARQPSPKAAAEA